jgi:hypothetical protein
MIHGPILAIRKLSSYFYVVLLAALKHENHKNFGYLLCFILFCKLTSCWCLTTTTVSWGRKVVCLLLQVARRVMIRLKCIYNF